MENFKNNTVLLIVDSDLDGSTSGWIMKRLFEVQNKNVEILHTTVKKFRTDLINFTTTKHSLDEYSMVYILDLDTHNDYEFIDFSNVEIIDHHKSHYENKHVYKKACVNVEIYSSCAKLCYKLYEKELKFNDKEKMLVILADDYDSYTLKTKQALMLNIVYWSYTGNRFEKFILDFGNGFEGFNIKHQNMVNIWKSRFKEAIENIMVFEKFITIDKVHYKCCSILGDFAINELAAYIFKKYKCDIVMIINNAVGRVYVRRNKDCTADMSKFVLSLCEKEAGGHEAAAGCKLNDNIMEMMKEFNRVA